MTVALFPVDWKKAAGQPCAGKHFIPGLLPIMQHFRIANMQAYPTLSLLLGAAAVRIQVHCSHALQAAQE